MLNISTNRELLERLIVAELIARPGEGPLARRHFPKGGRGPASGLRSLGSPGEPLPGRPVPPPPPTSRTATPGARPVVVAPVQAVGALGRSGADEAGVPTATSGELAPGAEPDTEEPG